MTGDEAKNLAVRVGVVEQAVADIRELARSIDASLRQLAQLETKHEETRSALGRAFTELEDHKDRIGAVEKEMPTIKLVRDWTIRAVIGVVTVVGLAGLGLVIIGH